MLDELGDNMIKQWLCRVLGCCADSISPPQDLENIDFNEVNTLLTAEFPNATLLLSDYMYKTTTLAEFDRFIKNDVTNNNIYVSEYYDCDDFSYSIMGHLSNQDWGCLTFGILWTSTPGGGHAVNCFIDKDRNVWILEPQDDSIFKCPSDWDPYLVMM